MTTFGAAVKRLLITVLTLMITCGIVFARTEPAWVDGQVIVRFDKSVSSAQIKTILDPTRFAVDRALVPSLNIYLVKLTPLIDVSEALEELKGYASVSWSQANHVLSERGVPDDTSFPSQWSLNQVSDADIDAPDAWDIATGGQDQTGDDIVVAVVDGGVRINHPDLVDNFWVNEDEIPLNGFDDDGNGYVDDINGWDAYDSNGVLPLYNHGTHVAGIVGARGNNGQMITGVNWNVKLMIIAASGTNTAIVSQGYNYVLTQKQRWWSSGGTTGANVVATNSSFGADFANCESGTYPIWNDLYNAMGAVGILSAAATANNNVDIDVVGDVPTGCSSPFIVSVTNTNVLDQKSGNAAYGDTTIDLGAPGTNILSTTSDGATGYLSGTSMATPHVAGAIALMHAAASLNFDSYYQAHPDSAALLLKDILLLQVDSIASMNGITLSAGRLNLFKAVDAISGYSGFGSLPNIRYVEHTVTDTVAGNSNYQLDRGESAELTVALRNVSFTATNVLATLSTTDPFITITDSLAVYGTIDRDSTVTNSADVFLISADSLAPLEHLAQVQLYITADSSYSVYRTFTLAVGQRVIYWTDSVASDDTLWTHSNVTAGFLDEWHISSELFSSPGYSWKCGNTNIAGNYSPFLDAGLVSPVIAITPQTLLTIDNWIDSELSTIYTDSAYDAGIVEVSENGGPFVLIAPIGNYNKTVRWFRGTSTPYNGPFPGLPCFAGSTAWLKKTFDLSSFAGDSVRIRFRFGSDSGTQREGWYVDNIVLQGEAPPPPVPVPPLPVDSLVIQAVGLDAILSWERTDTTVSRYVIYRNSVSDFVPTPLDSIGGTTLQQYIDSGILATDSLQLYYRVKSVRD